MNSKRGLVLALLIFLPFLLLLCLPPCSPACEDWSPLADRLIADGFDESAVRALFQSPELVFDPSIMRRKIESLIRKKYFETPVAGPRTTSKVYKGFVRPEVIETARAFMKENSKTLGDAQARYKVPKEIIVSILLVETKLGEYTGEKNALNSLASMALCADFEKVRPHISPELLNESTEDFAKRRCGTKADWAYAELKALIRYGSDNGIDPLKIRGSVYGAIGICQFMPTQVYLNGVDADGDGKIDVFTRADAFHSVANYLKNSGWKTKMSRKRQIKVIYAYNHSSVYANTVLTVAQRLSAKNVAKRKQSVKRA
ncbi:MAG: lytic murein transglycosylase [Syntrophaceae bacterium]